MQAKLSKVLDDCLVRLSKGETIDACLTQYPQLRQQLQSLLYTAVSVSHIPKVSPSDEFRKASKLRLMARLRDKSIQARVVKSGQATALADRLGVAWRIIVVAITQPSKKVAIPVTIALLLALGGGLLLSGAFRLPSPSPALVSQCTLSILSGSVATQSPGSNVWEETQDGITLEAGTRVKTAPQSQALLTFFEGTTIKLEPNTDITIERVEGGGAQPTEIVLKQWLGKTWSRVVRMLDPGSHYKIETPSAYALVRGTLFMTEVDETGSTTVQVTEGLVAVGGQNLEVNVPAGYETTVEAGANPPQPTPIEPPGQSDAGPPGVGPGGQGPPGQSDAGPPGVGPGGQGPPGQD